MTTALAYTRRVPGTGRRRLLPRIGPYNALAVAERVRQMRVNLGLDDKDLYGDERLMLDKTSWSRKIRCEDGQSFIVEECSIIFVILTERARQSGQEPPWLGFPFIDRESLKREAKRIGGRK